MKHTALILAGLLVATALPADAAELVPVTVDVSLFGVPYKSCGVLVEAGSTGGDALDAAVASGCLLEWTHQSFSFGRYVTSIDHVAADETTGLYGTFWGLSYNGAYSLVGIDDLSLAEGDAVGFDYTTWLTSLAGL
ncbi:MAG: DUF4430 domain-containing protein [Thermoplasmatota archaeon]